MSRAVSTPLVVGVKGSSLDLVMNTLYFNDEIPELMTMAEAGRIEDSGLALPIPVYSRFQARGYPIIGTTLEYFDFRKLVITDGRQLAIIGEAVLGAKVAEELELGPGDFLVSSPETPFDLAGVYPLKMNVVGILAKSHTSDDLAVFVGLKTAWIIEGLGHGHQDLIKNKDTSLILQRTETNEIGRLEGKHTVGFRIPERWVNVRQYGKNHLDMATDDSFSKVLEGIVHNSNRRLVIF